MHNDDELMDQLLRDAMAGDVPRLPPEFDARVMERVRPQRLTPAGRAIVTVYAVAASATAMWLMRDVRVEMIAIAVGVSAAVAIGASAYVRKLALG